MDKRSGEEMKAERKYALEKPNTGRNLETYLTSLKLSLEDFESKMVLNLGAGTADVMEAELERKLGAKKTTIIAYDAKMGKHGTERSGSSKNVQGIFGSLPFKDESFDMVISLFAFPYYASASGFGTHSTVETGRLIKQSIFSEVARVIKLGGKGTFYPVSRSQYSSILKTLEAAGISVLGEEIPQWNDLPGTVEEHTEQVRARTMVWEKVEVNGEPVISVYFKDTPAVE